jgi:hypothetical protein
MASTATFTATVTVGIVQITDANANRDGTGALESVLVAGGEGVRIDLIRAVATGTVTAGMIRLFLAVEPDVRLWKEIPVTATVPSATAEAFSVEYTPTLPLLIPAGWLLLASTQKAETFNVFAFGGTF